MSKISGIMGLGQRALMNSQNGLQVVGHNIANKATEGYSRQRVEVVANVPVGQGKLRFGTGSRTSAITRTNNSFLEKQIQKEKMDLGFSRGRAESLANVEEVFNEQAVKGLNKFMSDFFNAFREMAANPESLATRTMVRETGSHLANDFHRVVGQLKSIQSDIDTQITAHVTEINGLSEEIAQLNEKIQLVELNGAHANDERDRRDQLLKDLGEKINIKWAEGKDGQVTVTAGTSLLLVSGYSVMKLSTASTPATETKREGNVDILYHSSPNATEVVGTKQITGGLLGGILQVRDEVCNQLQDDMDQLAYNLSKHVNDAHVQGFDLHNEQGLEFFKNADELKGAAEKIRISDHIVADVARIAAGAHQFAPGDNTVANIIAAIQNKNILQDDSTTMDDFYNTIVGRTGVSVKQANLGLENQENVVKQLTKIRDSISGVSLDEEATKMIEYQKMFDASARVIRTADEMLETVLSIKR